MQRRSSAASTRSPPRHPPGGGVCRKGESRRGPRRGRWAWVVAALTAVLTQLSNANATEAMLWLPPAQMARVDHRLSQPPEWLPPGPSARLTPASILLVPVRPGDRLSIEGEALAAGLAYAGDGAHPELIHWLHGPAPTELRIASYLAPRFAAFRASRPTALTVRVATPRAPDDLREQRLDAAVGRWLARGGDPPPALGGSSERALRMLSALRRLMGGARGNSPSRGQTRRAERRWLAGQWQQMRLRERRLVAPYFERVPPEPSATRDQAVLRPEAPLRLAVVPGEVVSLGLSPAADTVGRFRVREGDWTWHTLRTLPARDALAAEDGGENAGEEEEGEEAPQEASAHPGPSAPEAGSPDPASAEWKATRHLRVLPRGRWLTVEALAGRARVEVSRYMPRRGLFDPELSHLPQASYAPAPPAAPSWLRELVAHHAAPSIAGLEPLQQRAEAAPEAPGEVQRAALAAVVALPHSLDRPGLAAQLQALWRGSLELPEPERVALWIEVLRRARPFAPADALEPTSAPLPALRGLAERSRDPLSGALLSALLDAAFPLHEGARPAYLGRADRALVDHPADRDALRLVRRAFRTAGGWNTLESPDAAPSLRLRPLSRLAGPEQTCSALGPYGPRWWVVPNQPTPLSVPSLGGTHAALVLRPVDRARVEPSAIVVDGASLFVHPLLQTPSRAGVAPGEHRIRRANGPEVAALLPWGARLPCAELREGEIWTALEGPTRFELPAPGELALVSLLLDASAAPKTGLVHLRLGEEPDQEEVWLRPGASGELRFAVRPRESSLRVTTDTPILTRLRIRLQPRRRAPPRPADSLPREAAPDRSEVEAEPSLSELRRLGTALRQAPDGERRRAIWGERARALAALGYVQLAQGDRARAGLPSHELATASGALFLPLATQAVVPLGLATRTEPMAFSGEPQALSRAGQWQRAGSSEKALEALIGELSPGRDSLGTLYGAVLASRLGRPAISAPLLQGLAASTGQTALAEAAAADHLALARAEGSLDHARSAFVLAHRGDPRAHATRRLLSQFGGRVRWRTPSLETLGERTIVVTSSAPVVDERSASARVRRALMLAPDRARSLYDSAELDVRAHRGQTLAVTSLCFARRGATERCSQSLFVDDAPLACDASGPSPPDRVARPVHCRVALGPESTTLRVELPEEGEPMGWVQLGLVDETDSTLRPAPRKTRYARLSRHSGTTVLHVMGPALVRFRVRAVGAAGGALQLTVASPTEAEGAERRTLPVSAEVDPTAFHNLGSEQFSPETRFEHVVDSARAQRLELRVASGDLLVRPEVAHVVEIPPAPEGEAPLAAPTAPALAGAPVRFDQDRGAVGPAPHRARDAPPLSSSATLSLIDRDLSDADDDASDRFLEIASELRQQLLGGRLYWQAVGYGRLRSGAPSLGARARVSVVPKGGLPGLNLRGRVAYQPRYRGYGLLGSFEAYHRTALTADLLLTGRAGMTFRSAADRARGRSDADGDVYSRYAAERPQSLDAQASLSHRPFIDTISSYYLGLRLDPTLRTLDRLSASSVLQVLSGAGHHPWLRAALEASHRPPGPYRRRAFSRLSVAPRATFWLWPRSDQRVLAELSLSAFADAPRSNFGVFAAARFRYDWVLRQGLQDYRPVERPFVDRLEEGGPALAPVPPRGDPEWSRSSEQEAPP